MPHIPQYHDSSKQAMELSIGIDEVSFPIQLSFQGQSVEVVGTLRMTASDLVEIARNKLFHDDPQLHSHEASQLKLLYKGRRLSSGKVGETAAVFTELPKKTPRIMVLVTETSRISALNSKRSDPTIRGFDHERPKPTLSTKMDPHWGPTTAQDKNYKFCRFQACTWQSFGHRPIDSTPHDFAALHLLEKLATDPGIKAILKERELVVGTLGEMDPIDDRLMQKKQQSGACLLGYNTNGGSRIDIKLRTDDLKAFRPYSQLAATLIHELSHNWVGEHNLLFWTNYGQMLAEYCATHAFFTVGVVVKGQNTPTVAGLPPFGSMDDVYMYVMADLTHEMAQHRLAPDVIGSAIRIRCDELEFTWQQQTLQSGQRQGGSNISGGSSGNPRENALQAAERRRREQNESNKKPTSDNR